MNHFPCPRRRPVVTRPSGDATYQSLTSRRFVVRRGAGRVFVRRPVEGLAWTDVTDGNGSGWLPDGSWVTRVVDLPPEGSFDLQVGEMQWTGLSVAMLRRNGIPDSVWVDDRQPPGMATDALVSGAPFELALAHIPPGTRVFASNDLGQWVDVTLPGRWDGTTYVVAPQTYTLPLSIRLDYPAGTTPATRVLPALYPPSDPLFMADRSRYTVEAAPVTTALRTLRIRGIPAGMESRVMLNGAAAVGAREGESWVFYGLPARQTALSVGPRTGTTDLRLGDGEVDFNAMPEPRPVLFENGGVIVAAETPVVRPAARPPVRATVQGDVIETDVIEGAAPPPPPPPPASALSVGRVAINNVPQMTASPDAPWRDVRLVYPAGAGIPVRATATNGRFESVDAPAGPCVLEVRLCSTRPGASDAVCTVTTRYPVTVVAGGTKELDFYTSPTVDGDAAGPQTGIDADVTGLPGTVLAARRLVTGRDGDAPSGEWMPLVPTSTAGRLALYALAPGNYAVRSQRDGVGAYGSVAVREAHVARIDLAHVTAPRPSWEAESSASDVTAAYSEFGLMSVRPLGADGRPTAVWQSLSRERPDAGARIRLALPAGRYELSVSSWRSNPGPAAGSITTHYGAFTLAAGETVDLDRVPATSVVPSWWSGTAGLRVTGVPEGAMLAIRPRAEPATEGAILDGSNAATGLAAGWWTVTGELPGRPPVTMVGDVELRAGATATVSFLALHGTAPAPSPTDSDTAMVIRACDTIALDGYPVPQRVCDGDRVVGRDGRTYIITLQPDGHLAPVLAPDQSADSNGMSTAQKALALLALAAASGGVWWWVKLPRANPGCGCGPSCGCEPCRAKHHPAPRRSARNGGRR